MGVAVRTAGQGLMPSASSLSKFVHGYLTLPLHNVLMPIVCIHICFRLARNVSRQFRCVCHPRPLTARRRWRHRDSPTF